MHATTKEYGLFYIKLLCLLFWACWFALVCTTNITDLLAVKGILSSDWHCRSGNYALLQSFVSIYNEPIRFVNILFYLDIAFNAISALLFSVAFFMFCFKRQAWCWINSAFLISLVLWTGFILMDELFIGYKYENEHMRIFIFELITLLTIHLLPHKNNENLS